MCDYEYLNELIRKKSFYNICMGPIMYFYIFQNYRTRKFIVVVFKLKRNIIMTKKAQF